MKKHNLKAISRRESMGQDSVWRLIRRFSLPAVISMTVTSSYSLVDAVFIGRLGAAPLAAMGTAFPLSLSLVAIGSGTAIGMTSLIARNMGAGNQELANRTAGVAITLCFLLSGIIAAVCLPTLTWIMSALGAHDVVLPLAHGYMSILITFNILAYLAMILANLIRADGNPFFSSSISIFTALLNIVLDPIFIFGLGPVPRMEIEGAAVATVIAQGAGCIINAVYILSGKTAYRFKPAYFFPHLKIIAEIYRVGTASIVRSGSQLMVMVVINNTAAAFGLIPLAIMGVLMRVGRFILMPILGLTQGMLPVIGYNFGAQHKQRVAEIVYKITLLGSGWTFLCWLVLMLFPAQIMNVFNSSPEFLNQSVWAVRLYGIALLALMLRTVPGLFFQGIGKGLPAIILTAAQNIVFLLIPILILPQFFGLTGLWIAFPVSDLLSLIFGQLWMNREFRRQNMSFFS